MTSLVERFDSLSINGEKEREDLFGYVFRTKKAKNYFLCNNDFIVIPSFDEKKMVLRKLERSISELCFLCFECENLTVFENMRSTENFVHTKSTSCIHVKLCKIIFAEVKSTKKGQQNRNATHVSVKNVSM